MIRPVACLALATGLAASLPASLAARGAAGPEAEFADRITALSLSAYLDEESSWSTEVSVDAPVGSRLHSFGSLGYSTLDLGPAPFTGASRTLDFGYGTAGLGYEHGGLSTDVSVSRWGDKDVVATTDLRAGVGYDTARAGVRLTGVYRDLDFTVRRLVPDIGLVTEDRSTNAVGVGLELSFSPTAAWRVYAGGESSDYDDDLEQLAARIPLRLLAQRQLTLSSSFPEWSWHGGTDVFVGAYRVNLEYAADQSVFGGLESSATSLAWQLPVGNTGRWAVDLRLGVARSDFSDSATFGLATLTLVY